MVDLGHWASGEYRVPTGDAPSSEDVPGAEGDGSTAWPEREPGDGA